MDIALLSMVLSQGQVQQQASMSVMKTALDQAQEGADGRSMGSDPHSAKVCSVNVVKYYSDGECDEFSSSFCLDGSTDWIYL